MNKKINTPTKYFLGIWGVIFLLAFIAFTILSAISYKKIYSGQIILVECEQNDMQIFDCEYKIKFDSAIFRYQHNISDITIDEIDYQISQDEIINPTHIDNKIYLKTKQNLNLDNLGSVSFSVSFMPFLKTALEDFLGGIFLWFFAIFIKRYIQHYIHSITTKNTDYPPLILCKTDEIFLSIAGFICFGMLAFTFWLGFPGYHINSDIYQSISLSKSNFSPVFISYVLQVIYIIFGKHLFYLFLLNLITFYLGIFMLIAGFYLRFKSYFALVLIFPTFIGNIYFQNFIQHNSFGITTLLFLLYSMVLFLILVPSILTTKLQKPLIIGIFIVAFFAILWRHNAIFSVFPIFFVLCFLLLKDRGLTRNDFVKKYISSVFVGAILCLVVVIVLPKIMSSSKTFPANHTFLHQIAGACVPNNDSSCFLDSWYLPNKNFKDVKAVYEKYPLFADPFSGYWPDTERPVKGGKLKNLKTQWLKSILKHPSSFAEHELRFIKAMWIQNPGWIFNAKEIQEKPTHKSHINVVKEFPENERSVTFSPLREQIYTTLYNHRITLNHIVGVASCFVVLILSSILLCFRRDSLLVFSFSVSFAGFFSALFIALFTPAVVEGRYMSPILPMAILCVVGFVAFVPNIFKAKK